MCALCDNLCDKGDCVTKKWNHYVFSILILSDSNPNGWYHEKLADLKINKLEMENNWCE